MAPVNLGQKSLGMLTAFVGSPCGIKGWPPDCLVRTLMSLPNFYPKYALKPLQKLDQTMLLSLLLSFYFVRLNASPVLKRTNTPSSPSTCTTRSGFPSPFTSLTDRVTSLFCTLPVGMM